LNCTDGTERNAVVFDLYRRYRTYCCCVWTVPTVQNVLLLCLNCTDGTERIAVVFELYRRYRTYCCCVLTVPTVQNILLLCLNCTDGTERTTVVFELYRRYRTYCCCVWTVPTVQNVLLLCLNCTDGTERIAVVFEPYRRYRTYYCCVWTVPTVQNVMLLCLNCTDGTERTAVVKLLRLQIINCEDGRNKILRNVGYLYPSARRYVQNVSIVHSIVTSQCVSVRLHAAWRSCTHNFTCRQVMPTVPWPCVLCSVGCGVAVSVDTADMCGSEW